MRVDAASPRLTPIASPRRPAPSSQPEGAGLAPSKGADRSGEVLRRRSSPPVRRGEPEKLANLLTSEEKRFIQRLFPSRSPGSAKPYRAVEGYTPRLGGMIDLRG